MASVLMLCKSKFRSRDLAIRSSTSVFRDAGARRRVEEKHVEGTRIRSGRISRDKPTYHRYQTRFALSTLQETSIHHNRQRMYNIPFSATTAARTIPNSML